MIPLEDKDFDFSTSDVDPQLYISVKSTLDLRPLQQQIIKNQTLRERVFKYKCKIELTDKELLEEIDVVGDLEKILEDEDDY